MLVRLLGTLRIWLNRLHLLPVVKRTVAAALTALGRLPGTDTLVLRLKQLVEGATFAGVEQVHDLPPIYAYWSECYLRPKCEQLGFSDLHDFYVVHVHRAAERLPTNRICRLVSIGSGNGDLEIEIARRLQSGSNRRFVIECLDANTSMLQRCADRARVAGVTEIVRPVRGDFNAWRPEGRFDVVIANHSLHHVLKLEALFHTIRQVLEPSGYFLTVDMIGRNGHMRWPEALAVVRELWRTLPSEKKFNHILRRHEREFTDWDASRWGFEGVRAQEVLPLLLQRFHFELFLAWGGIIDPFIDRSFGPNFDPADPEDRRLIAEISERNEAELLAGHVKPTQMFAAMTTAAGEETRFWKSLSPEGAVRKIPEARSKTRTTGGGL